MSGRGVINCWGPVDMSDNPHPTDPLSGPESSIYKEAELASADRPAVLIIDGSPYTRELLANVVSGQGYLAHTAPHIRAALKCLAQTTIDLIVLDIEWLGQRSFDLLHVLRSLDSTHQIPIVVLAKSSKKRDVLGVIKAGASGYIIKPQFSVEGFLERVAASLAS